MRKKKFNKIKEIKKKSRNTFININTSEKPHKNKLKYNRKNKHRSDEYDKI